MARALMLLALLWAAPALAQPVLDYNYKVPTRVAAFAPLKAYFDAERRKTRAEFNREAAQERASAKKDGYPFRGWGSTTEWKLVTETPRFLSLSGTLWSYTGGAHGNTGFDAMLYDKAAKRRLQPIALFAAPAALSRTIRADFCRLLDKEREKRRGEPVDRSDMFGECIDPVEQTIILGSRTGRAFDRIGVLIGPYAAGSYAEGAYDITLPVTRAIIAQVKPQYRGAFAVAR